MSISRRKKAIQKVVKLLNLATSTNASESGVALRHAESLIGQYAISQRELPMLQLCDRSMLYKVSWGKNAFKQTPKAEAKVKAESSVYQRRFSEKTASRNSVDSANAYASAKTILDDLESHSTNEAILDADISEEIVTESVSEKTDAESVSIEEVSARAEQSIADLDGSAPQEEELTISAGADNVIDASQAFRPAGFDFTQTLKNQYAASNPDVPFSEDAYWSEIEEKLAAFDEGKVQAQIDNLNAQLALAKENLQIKRQQRAKQEQEEVLERSERARIELSFEEAIERAFQARAVAYEVWEKECSRIRMDKLKDEQEAVEGFECVQQSLKEQQTALDQYEQRKADYQAAKIMHELRHHLALAASGEDGAEVSFQAVINSMSENGLSLKDLEFSDIKNKSLFIRLLEKESASIADVHEREEHTENMLEKFLSASLKQRQTRKHESPLQKIHALLSVANEGGQFEAQKSLEQVVHLMSVNNIDVRDIGYQHIRKYSVFIRLINWQAEQISVLSERERFTAKILEEYVQFSVKPTEMEFNQQAN
ncbi:DUF2786 domain-containing protein [Marinomonas sp.]